MHLVVLEMEGRVGVGLGSASPRVAGQATSRKARTAITPHCRKMISSRREDNFTWWSWRWRGWLG